MGRGGRPPTQPADTPVCGTLRAAINHVDDVVCGVGLLVVNDLVINTNKRRPSCLHGPRLFIYKSASAAGADGEGVRRPGPKRPRPGMGPEAGAGRRPPRGRDGRSAGRKHGLETG